MLQINLKQMGSNYSVKEYNKENMARALGRSLPISFKQSIEICNFIRNKKVDYAKNTLNKVIHQEIAIPFRKFNADMGHKKKIMAGRYPKKASMKILSLINHVEANAQFKGLNTSNLIISHINANKASNVMHFGRKRGRKAKRTNVEIIVQEDMDKKSGKKEITREKGKIEQDEKKQNKNPQEKKIEAKEENKIAK